MQLIIAKCGIALWFFYFYAFHKMVSAQKPNIIIIMADDMGINDVSFRGSNQILTPNIDALAYHGVILDRYYTPALCTPSRAALLSGKHPIHTGMQHYVIPSDEPWGLPLNVKIMPEIFREAGYSTNLVGKWHLGFYKKGFTPTQRGFDYHFGYYGGYIDYYDHSLIMLNKKYSRGYDMRRNLETDYETNGTYATDLFNNEAVRVIMNHDQSKPLLLLLNHLAPHTGNENDPMQAPESEVQKHSHISSILRRQYAAMVSKLDEGVGKVITALSDANMLNNSIVIFYSDNGAPALGVHSNSGSNHPLRGQKESPWEGGIRTAALIWSSLLERRERIFRQPMYATDWLPTLAAAAKIDLDLNLKLDGENMWDQLSTSEEMKNNRKILHNIDEIFGYSAYMNGPWKYINGTTEYGKYDRWLGQAGNESDSRSKDYVGTIFNSQVSQTLQKLSSVSNSLTGNKIETLRENSRIICPKLQIDDKEKLKYRCDPLQSPCLFNVEEDPCEYYNLAWKYPNILDMLKSEVENLRLSAIPSVRRPADPECDPALHNYTWSWWQDDDNHSGHRTDNRIVIVLVAVILLLALICVISSLFVYCRRNFHLNKTI